MLKVFSTKIQVDKKHAFEHMSYHVLNLICKSKMLKVFLSKNENAKKHAFLCSQIRIFTQVLHIFTLSIRFFAKSIAKHFLLVYSRDYKQGNSMIYSYSELRGKIKVGDKVRAVPGKCNACEELEDGHTALITGVCDNSFHINGCWHDYGNDSYLDLISEPKTLKDLKKGDVVVRSESGSKRKVLAVLEPGELYVLSALNNFDELSGHAEDHVWTIAELEERGWAPENIQQDDTVEVTLQEIADKLNIPVDKLRVKEQN